MKKEQTISMSSDCGSIWDSQAIFVERDKRVPMFYG